MDLLRSLFCYYLTPLFALYQQFAICRLDLYLKMGGFTTKRASRTRTIPATGKKKTHLNNFETFPTVNLGNNNNNFSPPPQKENFFLYRHVLKTNRYIRDGHLWSCTQGLDDLANVRHQHVHLVGASSVWFLRVTVASQVHRHDPLKNNVKLYIEKDGNVSTHLYQSRRLKKEKTGARISRGAPL